jgi:hypothetical protein
VLNGYVLDLLEPFRVIPVLAQSIKRAQRDANVEQVIVLVKMSVELGVHFS